MNINSTQVIKIIAEINFYISVILLVLGGILSVFGSHSFFQFNEDLYGALDNNLRMVMVYLAFTECMIVAYCWIRNKFQIMIIVGSFLIMMIGSLGFYGEINAVEIDPTFTSFFLYIGLSHIFYGVLVNRDKHTVSGRQPHSNVD
ncbi:MAG: hypothetical protein HOP23_12185 [Methylococcaceae bacterium]|nr:hypothetical protein [Methylococcaceae bacterium]